MAHGKASVSNFTFDRTVGSHSLAVAGQRDRETHICCCRERSTHKTSFLDDGALQRLGKPQALTRWLALFEKSGIGVK